MMIDQQPVTPERNQPRRGRLVILVLGVVMLVAGAVVTTLLVTRTQQPTATPRSATPAAVAPLTVTGDIVVSADVLSSGQAVGESCATADGYDDIRTGAQVAVRDAAGKVLAIGTLEPGTVAELYGEDALPALLGYASKCNFEFTVKGVPDGQQIYSVEVAHRGAVQYQRAQLDAVLALTLG